MLTFISGHGAFGMVYRGKLKGQTAVAIKTFKAGTMDTEAFLEEAELMKKLKHKNILSLLAIQTKAEPIMIGEFSKAFFVSSKFLTLLSLKD